MHYFQQSVSLFISLAVFATAGCAQQSGGYYAIDTPMGRMVVRTYEDTPGHSANFDSLVSEAYFDSTTFHRAIDGFMIQGGDPNSKSEPLQDDGQGGPGYTLPAEITPDRFHRRGAMAGARLGDDVNPERASNGSQFYIVQGGVPLSGTQLTQLEEQLRMQRRDPDFAFTDEARAAYTQSGGAPHLDGAYTVFGEVVEGFDVLDRIAGVRTMRKRLQEQDPTVDPNGVDPAVIDQPPEKIWMIIRPLPGYQPETR